jgi:hypothetical protein
MQREVVFIGTDDATDVALRQPILDLSGFCVRQRTPIDEYFGNLAIVVISRPTRVVYLSTDSRVDVVC